MKFFSDQDPVDFQIRDGKESNFRLGDVLRGDEGAISPIKGETFRGKQSLKSSVRSHRQEAHNFHGTTTPRKQGNVFLSKITSNSCDLLKLSL
jgi:hypothetical protein